MGVFLLLVRTSRVSATNHLALTGYCILPIRAAHAPRGWRFTEGDQIMTLFRTLALAVAAFTLSLPSLAQPTFAKPEDAVNYRQGALKKMKSHFDRLGAMASGRAPFDSKVAVENAEEFVAQARLPWAGFVPGTEKLSNKARPEIWTEQVKFKDSSEKLQAEAAKLLVAAKTNNLDNLKAAFGSTAASCKACHDSFRN